MVLQYLSNAGSEGAKRDSIYEYLKFRRKTMYFRRNLSQSVETISVTSIFDGYSEVNQLKKVASILATFFSIIFISYSKPASWLSSFRQPPKALSFLAYRLLSISREQAISLEEIALNGLLQLGLSDMKFIRCDVSVIHRHDIRIALHGEGQLIECLSILHVQYSSALLIYGIDANVHQILTISMPGLHIRNQLQNHCPPTSPSGRYDRTHRLHKQRLKFHSPFTITRAYS